VYSSFVFVKHLIYLFIHCTHYMKNKNKINVSINAWRINSLHLKNDYFSYIIRKLLTIYRELVHPVWLTRTCLNKYIRLICFYFVLFYLVWRVSIEILMIIIYVQWKFSHVYLSISKVTCLMQVIERKK